MDLLARSNYGINDDITPLFGNLVNDSLSSSGTDFSLWIEKQLLAPDKSEDSALRLTTSALLLRPGTYGEDFNASSTNSRTVVDSCQATWSKLFEPDWAESSDFSLPPTYNVFFLADCLYLPRNSALMFSHGFWKSRQRHSFDPTGGLSNLFSISA